MSGWRKAILAVATEEMTHLLFVANLGISIGARPDVGRPNFPVAPGCFPSGVVVRLQGFSLETLDHFVYLERPRGGEGKDGEGFEPIRRTTAPRRTPASCRASRTIQP